MAAAPVPIERHCHCLGGGIKRVPLRRYVENLAHLAEQLPGLRDFGYLELFSYRCPNCKRLVDITLGDLLGEGLSPA